MNEIVYANTGEVKSGNEHITLNSGAIGSCVVICIYNSMTKTGGMVHIMLPGRDPAENEQNTKFAFNAIQKLLKIMNADSVEASQLETCIIGGANVLKRPNDTIGINNIDSVERLLDEQGVRICKKAVGGFERRTAEFNIGKGYIFYTEGDSKPKVLWKAG